MNHTVDCYKCAKCGHINQSEPTNKDCNAWFGCDFEKGKYEIVRVPLQTIRKNEKVAEDKQASEAGCAVLWLLHAVILGFAKKSVLKGLLALLFGPFMWFF